MDHRLKSLAIITCAALCAGCWTFTRIDRDAGSSSDSDRIGDSNDGGGPTNSDLDSTDVAADMPDSRDAGAWVPVCDDAFNVPLIGNSWYPTVDEPGGILDSIDYVNGSDNGVFGTLAWIESSGQAWFGDIEFVDGDVPTYHLSETTGRYTPDNALDPFQAYSIALGPTAAGTGIVSAITGSGAGACDRGCPDGEGVNVEVSGTSGPICNPCSDNVEIYGVEWAGGFNQFAQESWLDPTMVFFEQRVTASAMLQRELVSIPESVSGNERVAIDDWDIPQIDLNPWIKATRGELVLLADSRGTMHLWDAGQAGQAAPTPPSPISIPGEQTRQTLAFEALSPTRYLLAHVEGRNIVLSELTYDPNVNRVTDTTWIGDLTTNMPPSSIALATFPGGFVVWYFEATDTGMRWVVEPYLQDGDTFRQAENCEQPLDFDTVEVFDIDVDAQRVGRELRVTAGVHFRIEGQNVQSVNVEGPWYPSFFAD